MQKENKTIVAFHIGRGGKFHNQGFLSFIGKNKIGDFTDNLFLNYENLDDVKKAIKDRPNLEKKFDKCLDDDNFSFFEKLGFDFGEKVYFDGGGNQVELTEKEEETGIGRINIDHDYDTTYTTYLDECDQKEVEAILNSSQWNSKNLLEQFFAENDVKMDWVKFNGNYNDLITAYFNFEVVPEEFYNEVIKKFVLAYDSGAKGTRYISQFDEKNGTSDENSAMFFDTREEAEIFIHKKEYFSCGISEIEVSITS